MKVIASVCRKFGEIRQGKTMYLLLREAIRRGHVSRILCTDSEIGGKSVVRLIPLADELQRLLAWLSKKGIFYENYRDPIIRLFDKRSQKFIREGYNIFYFWNYEVERALEKAQEKGLTTVMQAGTANPRFGISRKKKVSEKGPALKWWEKNRNKVDYIITSSDFAYHTYVHDDFPPERVYKVPQPLDEEKFLLEADVQPLVRKYPDNTFKVVAVGPSPIKGIKYTLEGWKNAEVDGELIVCGSAGRRIKKEIERTSAAKAVGFVDLIPYLKECSLFLRPSLAEGGPGAGLEAMAFMCPIIATRNSGIDIEDGKEGLIIPTKDSEAIREGIEYFYQNPDQVRMFGRRARKTALGHRSERVGRKLIKIFKELICRM